MKKGILIVIITLVGFIAFESKAQEYVPSEERRGKKEVRNRRGTADRNRGYTKVKRNRREVARVGSSRRAQPVLYTYDYDRRNSRRVRVRRGVKPSRRHIWVSGYWRYDPIRRCDVWVGGSWQLQRSYHRWRPGYYGAIGGSIGWINGGWVSVY